MLDYLYYIAHLYYMKRNVLQVRLTDKDLEKIKSMADFADVSVSEWVRSKILEFGDKEGRPKKNPIRREIEKITNEVIEETGDHLEKLKKSSVDNIMLDAEILLDSENKKCKYSNCQSFNTKKYQRSTGDFWLCDTHKP